MTKSWQQLTLEPQPLLRDRLEEELLAAGALALTLEDAGNQPLLEPAPGETPLWDQARIVALFPAETDVPGVLSLLSSRLGPGAVTGAAVSRLDDRLWELEWRRDYRPMRFGKRLWVSPPDALAECGPGAVTVLLEPGLAFGTGTHPTTALCLRWLDAHEVAGRRVLDYGCGSGILALAASALGATRVVATDIDPQALQATADNARRNCDAALHVCPTANLPHDPFDVVLANILAGTLSYLAPEFAARIRPGGDLVLSGLLQSQCEEVMHTYRSWFRFQPPLTMGDWCLLHGVRRDRANGPRETEPEAPFVMFGSR